MTPTDHGLGDQHSHIKCQEQMEEEVEEEMEEEEEEEEEEEYPQERQEIWTIETMAQS